MCKESKWKKRLKSNERIILNIIIVNQFPIMKKEIDASYLLK